MVATTEVNGTAGAIIPVGSAQSSLPAPDLAGLDTQTRKIGLIYPPPDIRAIADKTALYVFKNGPDFERRLTAAAVARNGKKFLTELASREHASPQFNFLKPTHSLFAFFTALCDAYSAADRAAMQSIDWHDFVVVETIDFFEDETGALPPPMLLRDVESEEEAEVRIVRDYVRVDPRAGRADPTGYVTSPLTGELVAVGDMAEHMRVSLIDPRWREQRNVMLSRIKETTRASDDEISRNLASLAATLPDVFGSSQEEGAHLGLEAGSSGDAALPPPPRGMSAWPPGFPRPPPVPQALPVPVAAVPAPSALPPQEAVLETVDVAAPLPAGAADAAAPVPADPSGGPTPSAADGAAEPAPGPASMTGPGEGEEGPAPGSPPAPKGEPPAKRAKIDMLEPEEEWLETHPGQCEILVACAAVEGHETLTGQTVPVHAPSLGLTVLAFKDLLVPALAIPANKQRLSAEGLGFLRDELSLAHYNVAPGDTLQLSIKERGRRRK
ncbi:putative splicing factor 3A subunit 1 [Auxenochlorella protothecoides]|uniref:Putative splicing factor 3A subunit 1 n=1 Tax=Auxenochlorella protothecoides TaxID=3075 RepID=A0A087SD46_AUXPR|nr:putative splicing factor 3A subunit 1 [Auxenochlorella protothecoides]KFM23650.1 putative splicing factor 3A subunit 1 [Auxenochlorella protothecoides]